MAYGSSRALTFTVNPPYYTPMRVKTWKVIDYGSVPKGSPMAPFTCPCGASAALPVIGRPLAQLDGGIVFDNDAAGAIPDVIQCRKCRRILERGHPNVR